MQAGTAKTKEEGNTSGKNAVKWIGIGDETFVFNGTFLGGDRFINRLYGNPLFINLGENACVEQLFISPIGTIDGSGALSETNAGVIAACKVIDDVTTTGGALVGTNSGTIYACYNTGDATKKVGETTESALLVGNNTGTIYGCYQVNKITTTIEELVTTLNNELDNWYNLTTYPGYTKYQYVYSAGSYPTVVKKL